MFRLNPGTGIVSGNRACGSESHGFWIGFDVLDVGAGDPKFTSAVAPGAFDNNEADTSAGAGFFVSQLDPRADGDIPGARIATTLASCIAWGNAEGGVMVGSDVGHLQIIHGKFLANGRAHVNYLSPPHADRWWSASNPNAPVVNGCLFFGDGFDALNLKGTPTGVDNRANMCSGGNGVNGFAGACAIAGPAGGWVTVNDAMFLSYSVPPIRSCGEGCANSGDGGYEIRFRGADFIDSSDVRVYFTTNGLKDNIVFDADGTLCDVDSLNILYSLSGVPAWIVPFRSSNSLSPDVS